MQEQRGTLTAVPSPKQPESDSVKRAKAWEKHHPGHRVGLAGPGKFTATDADGEILATAADLGQLMDQLDEQQYAADQEDLATLKRQYGHARSITYNADDWSGTRWDSRPRYNVGRDGEKITAASAAALAARHAEAGILPRHEERGGAE